MTKITEKPRVFISYRNEDNPHINWVRCFAEDLIQRDLTIVLDQFKQEQIDTHIDTTFGPSEGLHLWITCMRGCHAFIPIFTPGYIDRIGSEQPRTRNEINEGKDQWIEYEFQLSLKLGHMRLIETIPILRSGSFSILPPAFHKGNTLDLRSERDYHAKLDSLAVYLKEHRAVPSAPSYDDMWEGLVRYFD